MAAAREWAGCVASGMESTLNTREERALCHSYSCQGQGADTIVVLGVMVWVQPVALWLRCGPVAVVWVSLWPCGRGVALWPCVGVLCAGSVTVVGK